MESKYDSFMRLVSDLKSHVEGMEKETDRNKVEAHAKQARNVIDAIGVKLPYLYKEIHARAVSSSSRIISHDTKNAFGD